MSHLNLSQPPPQERNLLCQHPFPVCCLSMPPPQGLSGRLTVTLQGRRSQTVSLLAHDAWQPSARARKQGALWQSTQQLHSSKQYCAAVQPAAVSRSSLMQLWPHERTRSEATWQSC